MKNTLQSRTDGAGNTVSHSQFAMILQMSNKNKLTYRCLVIDISVLRMCAIHRQKTETQIGLNSALVKWYTTLCTIAVLVHYSYINNVQYINRHNISSHAYLCCFFFLLAQFDIWRSHCLISSRENILWNTKNPKKNNSFFSYVTIFTSAWRRKRNNFHFNIFSGA